MKYFYLFIVFTAVALTGCSNSDESETDVEKPEKLKDNFKITGKIENGQNLMFYLETQTQNGPIEVATAKSDAAGNFEMKGNIPGYGMYSLRMGETPEKVIPLTLVPNDDITIKASYASFGTPKVTGSSWTSAMTEYMEVYNKFSIGKMELELNTEGLDDEEINRRYQSLRDTVDAFAIEAMKNDPGNPFNFVLIASAFPQTSMGQWDPKNLELLNQVEHALSAKFPESPLVENLGYQVFQLEQEYNKYMLNNSGTQPAPEIALPNPDGEIMRLSDLRGKIVLVDFWASWCGPCRRENPNVVRLYKKYKDRGFTVFSVSLDDNANAWKAAIEKDGLIWPNHVSDLMRWSSPVIQAYGFSGIPYAVLINEEGNLIGVNLRGAELEQKLKEIFEK